jgi:sialate O-acetylesterase
MIERYVRALAAAAGLVIAVQSCTFAQPTPGQANSTSATKPLPFLSPIFGDNMVLQRGKPDSIWGWSDPGDTVRVEIGDKVATATAGADRRWELKIKPPAPGGP